MGELKYSLIVSIFLHAAFIYIVATGLPYFSRNLPGIEHPVPVEVLNIDDVTRVKKPEQQPEPEETTPEPVRSRPQPKLDNPIPNPDLKPKPKPDIERKQLVENIVPNTKPRPPTSFDAGKIAALIDKSKKDKPKPNDREKDIEKAVNQSRIAGIEAQRNTATISDFIKRRMEDCWSAPAGGLNVGEMLVYIRFQLNPDGYFIGQPKVMNQSEIIGSNNPFHRAVMESALRAVRLCEPYQLPKDMYDQWKELELKFDPSGMVG